MATPTIPEFLQGLQTYGLVLSACLIEDTVRLVLEGDEQVIARKPGIRKYIKEHREALLDALSQDDSDDGVPHCDGCQCALTESDFADGRVHVDEVLCEVLCMPCWQARNGPTEATEPTQPTLTPEQHIAELASVFPGCTVRMVPAGMSTSDYIDRFYAEQREQKRALANESGQERFWRELHDRLGGDKWDEYVARESVKQRPRIAAIAALPFTPQPERPPTQSAVVTLAKPEEEDTSDAGLLKRYRRALGTRKNASVFLSKPLVATNGFYPPNEALRTVQMALSEGGLRRESALDEMHFREHGESRKIR